MSKSDGFTLLPGQSVTLRPVLTTLVRKPDTKWWHLRKFEWREIRNEKDLKTYLPSMWKEYQEFKKKEEGNHGTA